MLPIRQLSACLIVSALVAASAFGHDGDPKLLSRRPAYPGKGWKNSERVGDDGNLLSVVPGIRFQRNNVRLFSWVTLPDFGQPAGGNANSCFGYTSPSGREYAIIGLYTGTAFVEITQPGNPVIVAQIPGAQSLWRDIRTFSTYAYAVSEGGGGIQVISLANIDNGSVGLVNTVSDDGEPKTHTVAVDPVTGYLYRSGGGAQGLRIYNLNPNPSTPIRVGTWSSRYSHEVSVFHFASGPAAGKDLAFVCGGVNDGFTSTGLYVVDVTNKASPVQLQYVTYPNATFAHQCWPSPDMQYLYLDDEVDNLNQTRVFNLSNPLAPTYINSFSNASASVDHNLYTKGNLIYESNYRSGLRVKSTSNPGTPTAPAEIAFFDTWPEDDATEYNGLWNNYPYFPSGTVIGSDIEKGLFVWWVGTPQITITPLAGDPDTVNPSGQTLSVAIGEITPGTLAPGTTKLHYDIGGGWTVVDMLHQGGGTYAATLPASACGTVVRYYYSAGSTNGIVWSEPEGAPDVVHEAISGVSLSVAQADDFQTNLGWVAGAAGDTATAGIWTRVDPNGTTIQTENDHTTGSGTMCWVTGQGSPGDAPNVADVDGGKTSLTSPAFDLTGLANPVVRYWRWYSNDWNSGDIFSGIEWGADVFRVFISNNNGSSFVPVEVVGPNDLDSIGGWMFHQFRVADYVAPTAQVKLRFVAEDAPQGSLVEAAIDDFQIVDPDCGGAVESVCFGDGTAAGCPCSNEGIAGHGCENSATTGGSILTATGTASVSADTLVLSAAGERTTAFSLFLQGDQEISPLIFGDGLRCTGGNLKRLYALNAVAGSVTAPTGADPSITVRSAALGDTIPSTGIRLYQVYYRDPTVGFCPAATFNVSNALRVVWGP